MWLRSWVLVTGLRGRAALWDFLLPLLSKQTQIIRENPSPQGPEDVATGCTGAGSVCTARRGPGRETGDGSWAGARNQPG